MTKQHFEAVARTCNLSYTHAPSQQVENILTTLIVNLADRFEQFNPRFNRSKFLAVALEGEGVPSLPEGACPSNVDTWG